MPYLDPPPYPAPVIVHKDVGGFVAEYRAATERYRAENREVRLHECRSACTLALSLPGVCVYPTSLLKFHKAYNTVTKEAHEGISQELFNAYPAAIQARLGGLTRQYRVLTGAELIALGVRNCADGQTQIARRQGESRTQVAAAGTSTPLPSSSSSGAASPSVGGMFQTVLAAVAKPFFDPTQTASIAPAAPSRATAGVGIGSGGLVGEVPLPPRRPSDLDQVEVAALATPQQPAETAETADPPRPPSGLSRLISGAQRILPSGGFMKIAWTGR